MNYLDEIALQIRERVDAHEMPEADSAILFRIYAVLLLAKGKHVTLADVHDAWSAWMSSQNATHESLVPYEELAEQAKRYDEPFRDAILETWEARSHS